jgi:polyferredoxin
VQVCPTGIDIRKGLQYECIGCGACIDVCDGVMDKMQYPRGLMRYATLNGMRQGWTQPQMLRRVLRPRVLVYTAILGSRWVSVQPADPLWAAQRQARTRSTSTSTTRTVTRT